MPTSLPPSHPSATPRPAPATAPAAARVRVLAATLASPAVLSAAAVLAAAAAAFAPLAAQEPLPEKRLVQPAGYRPSPAPLSPALLVGNTLYLSGATGGDPDTGRLVEGGFEAEFRQIMANYRRLLDEADMTLADVVQVTVFLADMADYALLNRLYREYFTSEPLPVRAAVAVGELARGARIELMMTAVRTR